MRRFVALFSSVKKNRAELVLLGFLSILMLSACFSTRKPTRPAPSRPAPSRPTAELPYGQMDTVRFTVDEKKPTIPSPSSGANSGNSPVELGRTYRIALVLPFLTDRFDPDSASVPKTARIGLQFWSGAKLALQQLSTEKGIDLAVSVVDSKSSDADFQAVLKKTALQKADLVIGGYRSSHVQLLADWGRSNGKIVFSPDIVSPGLARQNPRFVQLNPSLESHAEAIVRRVLKENRPENVVLVCREKERDRLALFQKYAPSRFAELVAPDAEEIFKTDLKAFFKPGQPTVFIVPSWSSQDFVNSLLQKIKAQRGRSTVQVFGMPQWMAFENIEPDLFESLAVHVSSARWTDLAAPEVDDFRQKFYLETGAVPNDDAFMGFDALMFAGRALRDGGLDFYKNLGRARFNGLSTRIEPKAVGSTGDDFSASEYWDNRGVFILRFEGYRFRPVD